MKKSQVEILGLMIIVVLIIIIALFLVRFMLLKQNQEPIIKSKAFADDLLNSMLKTTICNDNELVDAIISCYNQDNICNQDSCQLAENTINNMLIALEKSTNKLEYNENNLKLITSSYNDKILDLGSCDINTKDTITSNYPIRTNQVSLTITLYLCS